jgi:hypothetical protein
MLLVRCDFANRYQYAYITSFRRRNAKKQVSARPVTTAILFLRYPEGQPYYAYARNLHHRHRFDKESPIFAIYTQQLQLQLQPSKFESRRIKKVKRHFREIRPVKAFLGVRKIMHYAQYLRTHAVAMLLAHLINL